MDETSTSGAPTPGQEFRPGDTVAPQDQPAAVPAPQPEQPAPAEPAPDQSAADNVTDTAAKDNTALPAPAPSEPAATTSPSFDAETPPPEHDSAAPAVTWTASEFIAHDKSFGWYAALTGAAVVLAAIVFLLTRDKISTGVVIVAALALGIYGARKPHQLQYALDGQGVHIGQKYYPFGAFRSFAVIDEGAFSSIAFRPLKRFGQLVTIYFDPKDEAAIIDLLSNRLPLEPKHRDAVDSFMHKIRF